MIAARLAAWVVGHMAEDVTAFGIVVPVQDGVVMFLRGAVWGAVTDGGFTHQLSGEQALTWVDQLIPGTFDQLAIGSAADRPVQPDPLSDLRDGVVPGQGFVLTRLATADEPGPAAADADSAPPAWSPPAAAWTPRPAAAASRPRRAALAWQSPCTREPVCRSRVRAGGPSAGRARKPAEPVGPEPSSRRSPVGQAPEPAEPVRAGGTGRCGRSPPRRRPPRRAWRPPPRRTAPSAMHATP